MSETVTEALEELHKVIDEEGYNPSDHLLFDDEDLTVFAIHYLQSNLDHAFDGD